MSALKSMTTALSSDMIGSMRLRRFQVTPGALGLLFTRGRQLSVVRGIPEGSKFRGFSVDMVTNSLYICYEHASFDLVPEGHKIPEGDSILFRDLER